jgi:hypothetical protein
MHTKIRVSATKQLEILRKAQEITGGFQHHVESCEGCKNELCDTAVGMYREVKTTMNQLRVLGC